MSWQDTANELMKKYGVKEPSSTSGGGSWKDVAAELMDKYSPEKYQERATQVSDWADQYNDFVKRYSGYRNQIGNSYTDDFGGDYYGELSDLMQGYDEIKDFAGRTGLPNAQRYAGYLKDIQNDIGKTRQIMAHGEDVYNSYIQNQAKNAYIQQMKDKYNWDTVQELETALGGVSDEEDKNYLRSLYGQMSTQERYGGDVDQAEFDDLSARREEASNNYFDLLNQLNVYQSGGAMADSRLDSDPEMEALRKQVEAAKAEYDSLTEQKDELDRRNWFSEKSEYYEPISEEAQAAGNVEAKGKFGDNTFRYINNVDGYRDRLMETDKKNHGAEPFKKYDFMTSDEISTYNYLYANEGKKAAEDYLDFLSYYLDKQNMQRQAQDISDYASKNFGTAFLSSIASVPMNLASGAGLVDAAFQKGLSAIRGEYKPVNYNTSAFAPSVLSQSIRSTVSQNIADATGTIQIDSDKNPVLAQLLNGKSLADVYQLGMSMVDSGAVALMAAAGIPGGTALLGGSAGTQGMLDALERGATDDQAITMGVLNGAFEALFEYVSLDKLIDDDAVKPFLRRILEQGFVEGSEELSTTLANTFAADLRVMGDKSELMQAYYGYKDAGMSDQEASQKAWKDWGTGALWDFVGGAVSGGLMDLAFTPIQNQAMYNTYQQQYGQSAQELVDEALELNPENKTAQKAQERLQNNKQVTGKQLYQIVNSNEQTMKSQDKAAIQSAATQRLQELGETGDITKLSAALAKQAAGEKLNRSERRAIQFSQYGQRVSSELNAGNIQTGGYSSDWAERIGTNRINANEYNRLVQDSDLEDMDATVKSTEEQAETANESIKQGRVENRPFQLSDADGKTLLNKDDGSTEEINITGIASNENGKLMLNVEGKSEPVSAESISYGSAADAILYRSISNMDISTADATRFANLARNSGDTTGKFAEGMQQMYIMGRDGTPLKNAMDSGYGSALNDIAKHFGYDMGRKVYDSRTQKAESTAKKADSGKQSDSSQHKTSDKVHFDRKGRTFSEAQETGLKTMDLLSQVLGNEFYVFESYEKDGKRMYVDENGVERPAPNGFYDPATGAIHIDLNAGVGGNGTVLYTLSHELTHFIRDWSSEKFGALANAVVQMVYQQKNINVDDLIQDQIDKAHRNGLELTREEAYEEMIADSMEGILKDGEVLQQLMDEVKRQDATLWEKIVQWFQDLAEDIRRLVDAYKGKDPDSYEGRAVASMEEMLPVLEGFYSDALQTAGENFREAEKNTTREGDARYSLNENAETELHRALYDRSYKGEVLLRDVTPQIMLSQKGVRDLPMSMKASHIRENVFSEDEARKMGLRVGKGINYHGIGEELFLKIIDGLDNVKEAYRGTKNSDNPSRSTNYFLLISEFTDSDGNMVNVPVYIDEHGLVNDVFLDVNKISTVFGRNNLREYINRQVSNGELVRVKNRSNQSGESNAPIARDYGEDASKKSIRNSKPDVKQKFSMRDMGVDSMTDQEKEANANTVLKYFGKTYSWKETGYLTAKGYKVDFSGRHDGAPGGYLTVDHRDVSDALGEDYGGDSYSGAMVRFMAEGNIRISPESGGINLSVQPTKAQLDALSDFISKQRGEVILNIDEPGGDTVVSVEYPRGTYSSKVINDIRNYFETGEEPYVSELSRFRHSTRDPLQVDAAKNLERENEALKKDVDRLKELVKLQKQVTHGTVFSQNSIEDAARKLKKAADAKGDTKELAKHLNKLYDYIANERELVWEDVKEAAAPAVEWLWKNKQSHMDPLAEDVVNAMKGRKITLSEAQRREVISAFGSVAAFRSGLKGTAVLSAIGTKGAMDLDSFWQEMSASYPSVFDPDTVDTDMPAALVDIAQRMQSMSFKDYERESPEVQDAMRQDLLREVYDTYWDISSVRTVADKMQKEIDTMTLRHDRQMSDIREQQQEKIDALKLRHDRQMTELRNRNKESAATMKYRRSVEQKAKKLSSALIKNSAKEHIPEALKTTVGEFLQSIDFSSNQLRKGGTPTRRDMSYTATLDRLRQVLQKQENLMNGVENDAQLNGYYLDLPSGFAEEVQQHINSVAEVAGGMDAGNNQVYAMSSEDLKQLDYILTVINRSVSQMNKLLSNVHFQTVVEASQKSIQELNALGPDKSRGKLGNSAKRFLQWDNATPYYAFKRMGTAAQSIFEGLQDGWDKLAFNTQQVIDYAKKNYTSEEVKAWTKDNRFVKLSSGKTIRITIPQIMSIYCLSRRKPGIQHLLGGGIRVGAFEANKKVVSDAQNYTLTMEDIGNITKLLTDRQKKVADALQNFMNTVGTKWGNEVSMKRFGYNAFTEMFYFPLLTDANNRQTFTTDTQNANDLYRLLNLSMTKSLTENANNAVVINSIFDVFADHMSDMAKYNALAIPVLDAVKWYNFKTQSNVGESQIETSTVQKSLESAFGKDANNYVTNLLKDINGNHDGGKGTDHWTKKLMSNYKVAAVAGNLRVALLQPTAYVRATAVLSTNHLIRGLAVNPVKAAQEAEKYSGIAAWKSMGFYDTSIARGVRDQIKHDESVRGKIVEASMKGAEWGDRLTWGVLWNACKLEVKDNQNLSGDALMEATAKRFRDVVYRTQVVDSTMTRSQSMRDVKGLTGITTAFMAEPTLSYNMLLDAYSDYNGEVRRTGSKGKAWNKAGKAIFRTMVAYTVTNLAAALAEGLMDAWRDDDEYEKFYEKFLEHVGENFVEDMNPLTKLPIVKDAISYLQGYDNSRMDTEGVKNLVDALNIWAETIKLAFGWQSEPTSVTYNGNMTLYGKLYKTLKAVSQLSGIPFSNASREVASIWNNTLGVLTGSKLRTYDPGEKSNIKYAYIDGYLTEEEATRELLSKGLVEDSNEAYFQLKKWLTDESKYDALDAAIRGNGSIDSIVKELTSHGVEESDVLAHAKNAIGTWYKDGEISKQEATSMLKKYTDMDSDEVTAAVNKWRCKVDTGIAFEEIKSEFVSKHINAQRAADMYVKYGGYDKEDAEKLVAKWTAERDTGIAYEEIKSEFMGGKITESKAAEMYEKYGGYEPEEAQEKASVLSFVKNHPECDGISYSAIERYSEFCEPAGISANAFYLAYKDLNALESDKDENGDTVRIP